MTSEPPKKRRVVGKAKAKGLVVPKPNPEALPEHPIFWVECYGCSRNVRQERYSDGKAKLPEGWVTLFVTKRKSRQESPDVYAEEECSNRAAVQLSRFRDNADITILKAPSLAFLDLKITLTSEEG